MLLKGDYVVVDNTSSNLNKKVGIIIEKVETYNVDRYKVEILDNRVNYRIWDIARNHLSFVDPNALIDIALANKDELWFKELIERFKVSK